ncbi:MAG: hypothetical protein BWY05_01429 [Euryarchaeota archaeon ADurb.Bin165]|nr:MAG: hypothetical protein BWY05_01429 [Euryarchaeota archaeon ADurb.Bin165]
MNGLYPGLCSYCVLITDDITVIFFNRKLFVKYCIDKHRAPFPVNCKGIKTFTFTYYLFTRMSGKGNLCPVPCNYDTIPVNCKGWIRQVIQHVLYLPVRSAKVIFCLTFLNSKLYLMNKFSILCFWLSSFLQIVICTVVECFDDYLLSSFPSKKNKRDAVPAPPEML